MFPTSRFCYNPQLPVTWKLYGVFLRSEKHYTNIQYIVVVPVNSGEGTEVGAIPRIVQGVASVAWISTDLEFVIVLLAVEFKRGILCVPEAKRKALWLSAIPVSWRDRYQINEKREKVDHETSCIWGQERQVAWVWCLVTRFDTRYLIWPVIYREKTKIPYLLLPSKSSSSTLSMWSSVLVSM